MYNMWKNCMSNDWLYDDDRSNFSVLEFYTELVWAKMLKGAIQITELSMISIFELLTIAGTGNKKIFIEGKKSCVPARCTPASCVLETETEIINAHYQKQNHKNIFCS